MASKITRRSFLAGAAGTVAVGAAANYVGFDVWQQAKAAESSAHDADGPQDGEDVLAGHSCCNGCYNRCGFFAYTKAGRLSKVVPDPEHASSMGKMCARGYGFTQIAYSAHRLTDPLKRTEDGTFEAISWEQAYREIGERVSKIVDESGPESLALIESGACDADFYGQRLFHALGSNNIYTHGSACSSGKEGGLNQVVGSDSFSTDFANAKMVMFIGRSYADGVCPSSLADLASAHDRGCYVVMVDPRYNSTMKFCDEWVPINPGTDLAFILAMANVVVSNGWQDQDYIDQYTVGFETWEKDLAQYTPEWAEPICGVPADDIVRLATMFHENAPAASIENGWKAATGSAYRNSGEAARALGCFNALLGAYGREGGAYLPMWASFGDLTDERFAEPPEPEAPQLGSEEFPMVLHYMGSSRYLADKIDDGTVRGMFFCQSNMAFGYSNPQRIGEILDKLDLIVDIDVHMSETAMHADYVLPDTSYLERDDVVRTLGGSVSAVTLRSQVLDVIHPNTRPQWQIWTELAKACGVEQYFDFTLDELNEALLDTVGLTLDEMREKGTVTFPDETIDFDAPIEFWTDSGKLQFTSDAAEQMGLTPDPTWVEPEVMPDPDSPDEFRLIGGKQSVHSHGTTSDIEDLISISKEYGLDRIWINADKAAALGIRDGEKVEVYNDLARGEIRAKVTSRLNPTCVWMPLAYGCRSPWLMNGYGYGLNYMDFVPYQMDPYYASAENQETLVKIRKVGE